MPHLADDDYYREFARLVKRTLRPDVKVYVEWSNEPWHTGAALGWEGREEGRSQLCNDLFACSPARASEVLAQRAESAPTPRAA